MSNTYIDEMAAVLRRAEAAAYERGKADAKRELLEFLGHKDGQIAAAPARQAEVSTQVDPQQHGQQRIDHQPEASTSDRVEGRQRAPKGAARALAVRILKSAAIPMSATDILEKAETGFEKMIKPASMRSELRNGKREGLYTSHNGNWFLTEAARDEIEAEGKDLDVQPSASDNNNNGGYPNAAAINSSS